MPQDLARERVRSIMGDEAFAAAENAARSAAREEDVWLADVLPFPMSLDDAEPALALVTAGGMIVHGEVVQYRPSTAEERATTIAQAVSAAGRTSGQLPGRLHVRDAELAGILTPRLQPRGIEVAVAPLPELDEVLAAMLRDMGISDAAARKLTTPDTWRETGAPAAEVAAFHHAAAEFYRMAPWERTEMQAPASLVFPGGDSWAASVMGDGGVAFGVALYSDPGDLVAALAAADPMAAHERMQGYCITVDFDRRGPLTRAMLKEITAAGWPVAGPRAYPRLFGLNLEGNRVTAEHVRHATLALRALNALVGGRDPVAETGVGISSLPLPFGWDEVEEDDGEYDDDDGFLGWFMMRDEAQPMCAEGRGARPTAAIRLDGYDYRTVRAAEAERLARLKSWLPTAVQKVRQADYENARTWCEHLGSMGIPAGAVTEFDLRQFIYHLYQERAQPSRRAVRALRTSLDLIFRFLEEVDGIHYPFAQAVLAELRIVELRAKEDRMRPDEALGALSGYVYADLHIRAMLHERDPESGCAPWPESMSMPIALLNHELQRRWLLWYDDLVRRGTADFDDLRTRLLERQIEWENTPHPAHDGRTPAEVIRAGAESGASSGGDAATVAG